MYGHICSPSKPNSDESESENSEKEEPLTKVVKKHHKQRETSSDEDYIPLMELAKRMQEKDKLTN